MRFIVDESTGKRLHILLKSAGHDSLFVRDIMISSTDEAVLARSETEKERILITDDKDFGELIFRLGKPATGVIFLRPEETDPKQRFETLNKVINTQRMDGRQLHYCTKR
jgi:predicted nuclease of predicted toxin-antitoxin system